MKRLSCTILVLLLALAASPVRAQNADTTVTAPDMTAPSTAPAAPNMSHIIIQSDKKPQEDPLASPLDQLAKLPPQIQQELLDEAAKTKDYCTSNYLLSHFYDCSCFSLRMLSERIKLGPKADFMNMASSADYNVCVSQPNIAGYAFNRCHQILFMDRITDDQLKGICECVGRTMAKGYAAHPYPDINRIDGTFTGTLSACRQKAGVAP